MAKVRSFFPLAYEVFGTRKGHRTPRPWFVREAVPYAFETMDGVDATLSLAHVSCAVAGDRIWMPVNDGDGKPIDDADALADYASPRIGDYQPVAWLRPDEARPKGVSGMDEIAVDPGTDVSSAMRSVEWSGRDAAYARMRLYADRVAIVGGRPMTDRLEPVVPFGARWGETGAPYFADLVAGKVLFTYGRLEGLNDSFADRPFVSPSDGPAAGMAEWRFDPSFSAAAYLFRTIDDVLKARAGYRSYAHDCPPSFNRAVATLETVTVRETALGMPHTFGRDDLEACMRAIADARPDNPRHAATASGIASALASVREAFAFQDALVSAPSRADEDAFFLLSANR